MNDLIVRHALDKGTCVTVHCSEAMNSHSHNVIIVLLLSIGLDQSSNCIVGIIKNINNIELIVLCSVSCTLTVSLG